MVRRLARELAMKVLFARDLGKNEPSEIMLRLYEEENSSSEVKEFSSYLAEGVIKNQSLLDGVIDRYAIEWDLNRIAAVDRNILRIALYELIFSENTPAAVTINEAIEIAKTYGEKESPRFINGILGKVLKDLPNLQKER